MKALLPFLFFLLPFVLVGQNVSGARVTGMGGLSSVITAEDALFNNQAGLAAVRNLAVISAVEKRYLWSGINMAGAGVILPSLSGNFGLSFQAFGFSEFKQQKIGIAYGRKLWQAIHLGGQLNYRNISIPEYGSTGVFSFELGLQASLSKDLLIGTRIDNPYQMKLNEEESLPAIFQIGLLYKVSNKVSIGAELEKEIENELRIKLGLEYNPVEKISVRMGYSDNPANYHFGFGTNLKENMRIDLATKYDLTIGSSITVGVIYEFSGQ